MREVFKVNVEKVDGVLVTTSNKVAEELGVLHKDLLEKIDAYVDNFRSTKLCAKLYMPSVYRDENGNFDSAEISAQFYIPHNYRDKSGKTNRSYLITEKGIAQLVGGYSGAVSKAFYLNIAYINEFERMKKALKEPKSMVREIDCIRNEITLDNKLTYHGVPILITRQLNKLVGYDISLKLSAVKGRSVIRNEEVKDLKKENNILSNWITYTAVYYEENLNELLQKVKELKVYEPELVAYFTDSGTKLKLERRDIEIALRLLDNITDTAVKERISIGILEKLGYQSN